MRDHPNDYIIENTSIAGLTYSEILKHSAEIFGTEHRDYFEIQPQSIEIDFGLFTKSSPVIDFPIVSVAQVNNSLVLSCPCMASKRTLCSHQVQVLQTIINQPALRMFYDPELRLSKIRQVAKDYGMETEEDLGDFFSITYQNKAVEIKPKVNGLLRIDQDTNTYFKDKLLPKASPAAAAIANEQDKKMILVLRRHKYYDILNIELYEGTVTKSGKIKNPLTFVEPLGLIWKTEKIEEAKFFTGVSKFQVNHSESNPVADLEALRMVVNNPAQLAVFHHDKNISENVTASSIVAVQLKMLDTDVKLSVFKKDPFYEVSGELVINSKAYPFKELNVKYNYFIQTGNVLNFIASADAFRIIDFFRANNQKVLVHASKFEAFQKNILTQLENKVDINYAYIKPATKKQMAEQRFDQPVEKTIYLSAEGNYIAITPVVRYGNVEVPVFSRRQVHDTDQNGNIFKVERDDELELQFTAVLMRQHPYFEEQLRESEYFYLHKDKFLDEAWFLNAFEEWRQQGILILGFNELEKNKLNANKAALSINIVSGTDWFNAVLVIRYGKQKATLKQLNKAIRNKGKFVQLDDGTLGILPAEWMQKIAAYLQAGEIDGEIIKIAKSNFTEINKLFDIAVLSTEIKNELAEYTAKLSDHKDITTVEAPEELNATLRDYQLQGLNWLNLLDDLNFGGCLADDMGLGKTIQIIAFILLQRKKQKHNTNLVVVPTSLLFNWQAEVAKFAPSVQLFTHYGADRIKNAEEFGRYEIVLTTYGMLLSDIRFLKDYRFNYIFLDESQAVKNPESQRYKAARALQSRNKVVLTGTPVENNTFDLYGQLSFACPGLLGNKQNFKEVYAFPIDKFGDTKRAIELQQKTSPFILRRTKKEVARELPDKTEMVVYCEMGEEQRKIYNECEKELREYISTKSDDEITKSSMHVLTGLTKLRQICNSPALLKDEAHLGNFSSKIDTLMEQIENRSSQHKILVFSQFVSMLDLIKKALELKNIAFEYLTGQTKNRGDKVNNFQDNKDVRVFLVSLKAGGTGLNLTEADYVYLVDPWWNPAVENQAIDRCYRIGQKKNVIAVRLICPDTVEEKIMKLQESKTKLVNDLVKTDNAILRSFSKADLVAMLGSMKL